MTRRRPTYKRRGTLHLLAGLMIASAILRISAGSGAAIAEDSPVAIPAPTDPPIVAASDAAPAVDPGSLLEALRAREAAVAEREQQLSDRIQALEIVESEIAEQLAALTEAEETLRSTIALADAAAETDLGRLATVYENMKPKDAAALFEEMSPAFAAGFLGLMRPEAAAQIMTLLEPSTAYSISVVLAGRNVGVPTE